MAVYGEFCSILLEEVWTLPGFPYFANESFAVSERGRTLHCHSLDDFHKVFRVEVPVDSIGYVRLSDDGKVMFVSGDAGDFWLYVKS